MSQAYNRFLRELKLAVMNSQAPRNLKTRQSRQQPILEANPERQEETSEKTNPIPSRAHPSAFRFALLLRAFFADAAAGATARTSSPRRRATTFADSVSKLMS